MAESLVWKDISMKQIYDFNGQPQYEDSIKCIQKWFNIEDESDQNGIVLDFYFHTLNFAKEQQFSPEKTSAFFSIMKQTHEKTISSPFVMMEKDFAYFKDLVLKHSIHRPPMSEKIFSFTDIRVITDYALHTYFRHYVMYKYAFTKKVRLDFRVDNAEMTPKVQSLESIPPQELDAANTEGSPVPGITLSPEVVPLEAATLQAIAATEKSHDEPAHPLETARSSLHLDQVAAPLHPPAEEEKTISSLVAAISSDHVHGAHASTLSLNMAPSPPPALTKQEIAMNELKNFVIATLTPKLEEMKVSLMAKVAAQEESITTRIKKLEEEEKQLTGAQGDKAKQSKTVKKK
ncbi:hypothetical protein HDU97_003131 [Phlyctochytrium planicorne]|nr:hypothetical protein HDU97_003082 [Phlyctochytrium planicorne]KAJ3109701.1 hypothetical protein HDU97_003131 [Phlyctochytrium planicorne]